MAGAFRGPMVVVYIAFSPLTVQHLGVLDFTLFIVAEILFGSLLIDIFAPTQGIFISWY
jgi:transporter family-2 protein